MSERANASVIPFKVDDEPGEEASAQNSQQNPAERLHLAEAVRMAEAIVFASAQPVSEKQLAARLPDGINIAVAMAELQQIYARRGVNLVRVGDAWAFRTAGDLAFLMSRDTVQQRKLSRAALEVLAIIAYHQPVTRAEIEDIRGVETSKGTLDTLLETEWVRMRGRRRTPGRPVTYGTTDTDVYKRQDHQSAPVTEYQSPGQAEAYQSQAISDEDFAGHFDDAMTDVGLDFDQPVADQSAAMIEELDAHDVHAEPLAARDATVGLASTEAFDHDFDLSFDDALVEEAREPLAQAAAPAVQPAVTVPVAPVVQPVQAPAASERSLEDELNALLGAMSARTAPVAANEPAMAQQPVVQQPVAVIEGTAEEPMDLVGDLDWDLDDHAA